MIIPTDFEQAKMQRDRLEAEYRRASSALKALSGGGPMNLTPTSVRVTPEWQRAKRESDAAFAALRSFNEIYTRRFGREIARDCRMRERRQIGPRVREPRESDLEYRGFLIEKIDAIQVGYDIERTAGTNRPKTRKIGSTYVVTYPDSGAKKSFSSLRAAKLYIDGYLS